MNKSEAHENANKIKQSMRLYMNGVTAQSLREKGSGYKLSWGVSLQHLQEIAGEYPMDYELAMELWQSDVRECKLLATMLMPAEKMTLETALEWMQQAKTSELADWLTFNLMQKLPFAADLAEVWIKSDNEILQTSGLNLAGRMFMKMQNSGEEPSAEDMDDFLSDAARALRSENLSVRHAAMNSIIRFADLGVEYAEKAQDATEKEGFDFL